MAYADYFQPSGTARQVALVREALATVTPRLSLRLPCPITFKDLSGYAMSVQDDHFHAHGEPNTESHGVAVAGAPAGLFWWSYDGSKTPVKCWIEIDPSLSDAFTKEVVLAEAAHAFDLVGVEWNDVKRGQIYDAYHNLPPGTTGPIPWYWQGTSSHPHGWFGPQPYYDTPGESFMSLFMAGASTLRLSGATRWSHQADAGDVALFQRLIGVGGEEASLKTQFLSELNKSTLFAKWATANPGEYQRAMAFYTNGGTPPTMVTPFGRALVLALGGLP